MPRLLNDDVGGGLERALAKEKTERGLALANVMRAAPYFQMGCTKKKKKKLTGSFRVDNGEQCLPSTTSEKLFQGVGVIRMGVGGSGSTKNLLLLLQRKKKKEKRSCYQYRKIAPLVCHPYLPRKTDPAYTRMSPNANHSTISRHPS